MTTRNELAAKIHQAIEDALVDLRDNRTSVLNAANGLVIREADGGDSAVVRMTVRDAAWIAAGVVLEAPDTPQIGT